MFAVFRSLHMKLMLILLLLITSLMAVVGAFLTTSVSSFYIDTFYEQISAVFSDDSDGYVSTLRARAAEPDGAAGIKEMLEGRAGSLGIDYRTRNYFILDGQSGTYLDGSAEASELPREQTANLLTARNAVAQGDSTLVGDRSDITADYMDAAIPIMGGGNAYIIYILDNKDTVTDLNSQLFLIIMQALVIGLLIFIFPPLYGEGYEAMVDLMHGNIDALFDNSMFFSYRHIGWLVALYLVATLFFKVVAMAATTAAGGVGGTFAPSLFVGAFTGASAAFILDTYFGFDVPIVSFTLVGMAGVMSGVMKAPLTSIFLIAELTNGYSLFVPLMLTSAVSFGISYYFEPYSIYTKKLYQSGELLTHNKDRSVLVFLDLKRLMETDFHPVTMDTTLGDVVRLISSVRRNIFPVVSRDGVLLGVVQLDDLRADMFDPAKYDTKIDAYMIPPPDVVYPNEQMGSVLDAFEQSKAWMLPVIDSDRHYLGFISKSRILAAYRDQLVAISEE